MTIMPRQSWHRKAISPECWRWFCQNAPRNFIAPISLEMKAWGRASSMGSTVGLSCSRPVNTKGSIYFLSTHTSNKTECWQTKALEGINRQRAALPRFYCYDQKTDTNDSRVAMNLILIFITLRFMYWFSNLPGGFLQMTPCQGILLCQKMPVYQALNIFWG